MYQNLALLTAFLLFYSIFAGRFESSLLNGPLMFMLAGLILGPAVLDILQLRIGREGLKDLAELTLAIVLFSGPFWQPCWRLPTQRWARRLSATPRLPLPCVKG